MSNLTCVVTTIQEPTRCVVRLAEAMKQVGGRIIVMGDRKGPAKFAIEPADFFSLEAQGKMGFALATHLPAGHYARKNLGYLEAIRRKAECIYETDDDNMPSDTWKPRERTTKAQRVAERKWINVYRLYSDENIWPRGFPLDLITNPETFAHDAPTKIESFDCPLQQGLADLAPDVDAVWRLVINTEFYFKPGPSFWLPAGTWCPFNSQTTWWWPVVYPLLYLPSYCSFRMTDIWRSFIAQRCLWELGHGLVFHAAEVLQERNTHNLLRDFKDEVPGYLHNHDIVKRLTELKLASGPGNVNANLIRCYEELTGAGFIGKEEMPLVKAWVDDLELLSR